MTAGIETLKILQQPGVWESMEKTGAQLVAGLQTVAKKADISITANRLGTMFGLFFQEGPVTNWETAVQSDTERFGRYFQAMLANGVYLAPSQFEAGFISTAHGEAESNATIAAAETAMAHL